MTIIYTVKAIVGHDYGSEKDSIILTTIDQKKALNFASEYHHDNHMIAISVSGYDYFIVNVYQHNLEEECSEVLIYSSNIKDKTQITDTSFPRLFSNKYIENELKYFYNRKGSVLPSKLNVTLGDVYNNTTVKPIESEQTKEEFLSFIKSEMERVISYASFEKKIYEITIPEEKIEDASDWELYYSFEKKYIK